MILEVVVFCGVYDTFSTPNSTTSEDQNPWSSNHDVEIANCVFALMYLKEKVLEVQA